MLRKDIFLRHGIQSDPVLLLAPMEGITNRCFRTLICMRGGVDLVATEFIRITSGKQKLQPFTRHGEFGVPLQIQFMGTCPEVLHGCLSNLYARGLLLSTDWVDFNVGCPSKRVNSHGAGAALLRDLPKLAEIIQALREAHSGPLSMKTRLGYHSEEDFPSILASLSSCALDFITIHARSRCGGYSQPVLLEYLRDAVSALPFPVIGNGDVWTPEDAARMLEFTGVRGVMCGRGVARNPWLFKDTRRLLRGGGETPSRMKQAEMLCSDALWLLQQYREEEARRRRQLVGVYKEFSVWLSRNPIVGRNYFQRIKRLTTLSEIRMETERYFGELARSFASDTPSTAVQHLPNGHSFGQNRVVP